MAERVHAHVPTVDDPWITTPALDLPVLIGRALIRDAACPVFLIG
jgi:hypothetical protein